MTEIDLGENTYTSGVRALWEGWSCERKRGTQAENWYVNCTSIKLLKKKKDLIPVGFVRCTSYSNSYKHKLRFILVLIWIRINGYLREKALGFGLGKMFQTTYGSMTNTGVFRLIHFCFLSWEGSMTLQKTVDLIRVLQCTYEFVEQEGAWEKWLPQVIRNLWR